MTRRDKLVGILGAIAFGSAFLVQAGSDLGRLSFPNSGPPEAQDAFVRGVLLLHSFEYEDAVKRLATRSSVWLR